MTTVAFALPRVRSATHAVPPIGWSDGTVRSWTLHHPTCPMRCPASALCPDCSALVVTWSGPPTFSIVLQPHRGEPVALGLTAHHLKNALWAAFSGANEMGFVAALRVKAPAVVAPEHRADPEEMKRRARRALEAFGERPQF